MPRVNTFNVRQDPERPLREGGTLFSPQNKPPLSQETRLKAPTIPLQKALLHKGPENLLTLQE